MWCRAQSFWSQEYLQNHPESSLNHLIQPQSSVALSGQKMRLQLKHLCESNANTWMEFKDSSIAACRLWKHFSHIWGFSFLLLISSSFLLITHSVFGDSEIGLCFVCAPGVDSFRMCTWIFLNLCAHHYSSAPTRCSSSLWIFKDHRLVGLCKLCESRTDRFQVSL